MKEVTGVPWHRVVLPRVAAGGRQAVLWTLFWQTGGNVMYRASAFLPISHGTGCRADIPITLGA
jgi:hypothetical protein